ncbi:hypothetical protein LY78DRAFT_291112 [Colletotrichum sublineola]|nr:hypothetical protein LY78DRAFT_291112 [Colletotrichum sublineola]
MECGREIKLGKQQQDKSRRYEAEFSCAVGLGMFPHHPLDTAVLLNSHQRACETGKKKRREMREMSTKGRLIDASKDQSRPVGNKDTDNRQPHQYFSKVHRRARFGPEQTWLEASQGPKDRLPRPLLFPASLVSGRHQLDDGPLARHPQSEMPARLLPIVPCWVTIWHQRARDRER